MADLQRLMAIVRRLEEQGIDVADLLERQAPMPEFRLFTGPEPGAIDDRPMPEFRRFIGPGPGAIVDDMRMPEFKPFTGPGPGAVVTEQDMEMVRRRMMRDRMNRQNPVAGLLQLFGER